MKRRIISVLLVGLLLVCTACGDKAASNQSNTGLIESASDTPTLVEVSYADIEDAVYTLGEVSPYVENLRTVKDGTFQEFLVSMGDDVTEGQILAVMENPYEETIKSLKKQIRSMEISYENTITNYDLSIRNNNWQTAQKRERMLASDASNPFFDDLCISYEMQAAESERLELQKAHYMEETGLELNYLRNRVSTLENKVNTNVIKAPFSGKVVFLASIQVGDYLGKGFPAIAIADLNKAYVVISDIWKETAAQKASYVYGMVGDKQVELAYYMYDEDEVIQINNNDEVLITKFEMTKEQLPLGENVVVAVVKDSRKSVLAVPTLCVYRNQGKTYVDKYEDGEKIPAEVQIGLSDKFHTEILSGLEKGDLIYGAN